MRAYFSGLGCVSLKIDGTPVTDALNLLSPGFSTIPSERILYDTADVTRFFSDDDDREHVVEISAGMCKYGYMDNTDRGLFCVGAHGSSAACRAIYFSLETDDDVVLLDTSNASDWIATTENNPITYTHLYHGEIYDANRESFDPTLWRDAEAYDFHANAQIGPPRFFTPSGDLPPIGVAETLAPVNVFRVTGSDGAPAWVFDFGTNVAGVTRVNNVNDLPPNVTITLRHAEILQSDSNHTVQNSYCAWPCPTDCGQADGGNCANQTDRYRSSATSSASTWQPTHTYHGFRYVQVEGWPSASSSSPPNVTALVMHTLLADAANVHFENKSLEILNKIQDAIRTTQLANVVSIPTDCPQREKRGWLGDAQWTSGEASTNFDMRGLYRNFLRSMGDTQTVSCRLPEEKTTTLSSAPQPLDYECCDPAKPTFGCSWLGVTDNFTDRVGAIADVVPYGKKTYGGFPGDPSWTVAPAIIAWETWRRTGDTSVVRDAYDVAKALTDFLTRHGDASYDGLVRFGYYGDWLALAPTPVPQVSSFSHILAVDRMRDMAGVLGKTADVATYASLRDRLAKTWDETYWNATSQSYGNSQTANALALYMLGKSLSANRTRGALDALVRDLEDNDYALTTGALGARYVFEALGANGRADVALNVLTKTTAPSLGYMVEEGPGTIWENWSGDRYHADGSKSHPMFSGGVGLYLYDLAGYVAEPTTSGGLEHHMRVHTHLVGEASVRNRRMRASWKMTRGVRFEMNVTLEEDGRAQRETVRVSLPSWADCHRVEETRRGVVAYFGPSCDARGDAWPWRTAKADDAAVSFVVKEAGSLSLVVTRWFMNSWGGGTC